MFDSTSNLVPFSPDSDDRPLPERIAAQHRFPLAYKDHDDGRRYYAVRDWIAGVAKAPDPGDFWKKLKRRVANAGIDWGDSVSPLPYKGSKRLVDHAEAETLYQITQRMDASTGLRNEVLAYLAKAGVVLDEIYRDPDKADQVAASSRENKEYRKLRTEGFTHEEAMQWLRMRDYGIGARKSITDIWVKRNARSYIWKLTNQVSQIVHGKTATLRKQEMGLAKHDTPRKYDAAADLLLSAIAELSAGTLHEWRDSDGVEQLSEDIDDTKPIVDGARPGVYAAFSKKPRRLPGENKPSISG
jgi:hypothetical protein